MLSSWGTPPESPAPARPNIIFILADDMGFSDMGAYGGEIPTPHLDRLARNGVRFTQFYSAGRCCPTRASALTGLYQHEAGVGYMAMDFKIKSYRGELSRRSVTLAEVLGASGYGTYLSGKWHLTPNNQPKASRDSWPLQRGFDRFYGTIHGSENYFQPTRLARDNERIPPSKYPFLQDPDYYLTDDTTREALEQLAYHRETKRAKPFFMYLAYHAPHWPLQAPEALVERFRGKYDQGWDVLRSQRFHRQQELGLADPSWKLSPRSKGVRPWSELSAGEQANMARRMEIYAAQMVSLDENIGRIVSYLKKTGQYENTLILFFSDNGANAEGGELGFGSQENLNEAALSSLFLTYGTGWANASNTPFRLYKHYVHEGGITSPAILSWPAGIDPGQQGSIARDPVHIIDVMPTFIDAARTRYPWFRQDRRVLDARGVSFLPVLKGRPVRREEPLFFEHEGNQAIRDGDWKLVLRVGGGWQLYNLGEDRTEVVDLMEKYPDRFLVMRNQWRVWAREVKVMSFSQFRRIRKSLQDISLEDEG